MFSSVPPSPAEVAAVSPTFPPLSEVVPHLVIVAVPPVGFDVASDAVVPRAGPAPVAASLGGAQPSAALPSSAALLPSTALPFSAALPFSGALRFLDLRAAAAAEIFASSSMGKDGVGLDTGAGPDETLELESPTLVVVATSFGDELTTGVEPTSDEGSFSSICCWLSGYIPLKMVGLLRFGWFFSCRG